MSGKAYGKNLPYGFRGAVSRQPDTLVMPFTNLGTTNIGYGEPVVFDTTKKGVRQVASGDATSAIIGLAVRRVGQPYVDDPMGYYYKAGDTVDVLVRGSMTVEVLDTTGIAARGKVYCCNGSAASTDEDRVAGAIVAQAASGDSPDTIEVPNTVFATGVCDSNNIAEVTILTRSI